MRINNIKAYPCFLGGTNNRLKRFKRHYRETINSDIDCKQEALSEGRILDKYGYIFTRPSTNYFRSDLNWSKFIDYIDKKFPKHGVKTNIYIYGCSTGEEPYSLAMLLIKNFDDYKQRFSKIEAKDISEAPIKANKKKQKTGVLIERYLYDKLKRTLGDNEETLKKCISTYNDSDGFELSSDVVDFVNYSQANILNDIENIDSTKPAIVMARNMWPYVNPDRYNQFARKLYEKLMPDSIVVIGSYDYGGESGYIGSDKFPDALSDAGFKPIDICTCYEKYVMMAKEMPEERSLIFER